MDKMKWMTEMSALTGLDDTILSEEFDKNYKESIVRLNNSVSGQSISVPATEFLNDLFKTKIVVESGAIFMNHHNSSSAVAKIVDMQRAVRSYYKSKFLEYKELGEFITMGRYDLSQKNIKRVMNSAYGISIMPYSKFFNIDVASSTTARGRGTVSLNGLTMETHLGHYRPYNLVIHMDFINKCISKYVSEDILDTLPEVDIPMTISNILGKKHYSTKYYGYNILYNRLYKLSKNELKKIYYTSNIDAFLQIPKVIELLDTILSIQALYIDDGINLESKRKKEIIYLDPMNPPENIKAYVDVLLKYIREVLFGYYWYEGDFTQSGIYRDLPETVFKSIERESVLITDTDSIIVLLQTIIDKMMDIVPNKDYIKSHINSDFLNLIGGSIVILMMSTLCNIGLARYTEHSLIPEDYRHYIKYKQEFFFRTIQVTAGAKNYMGIIKVQEGKYLDIESIDLKGLSLKKSNFNKLLSEKARYIAIDMIAKQDTPNIQAIFEEIENVRSELPKIFKQKDNLDIFTVIKLKTGYDDTPAGEYRLKAVKLYNALFDDTITLPGSFRTCKLYLKDCEEEIAEKYPDIYDKLLKYVDTLSVELTIAGIESGILTAYNIDTIELIPDVETLNFIQDIKTYNDFESLHTCLGLYRKELRKSDKKSAQILLKVIKSRKMNIGDIDRIALPLDANIVPEFISDYVDIHEVDVFENLLAVLIEGLGVITPRNSKDRQIIHNIINYY